MKTIGNILAILALTSGMALGQITKLDLILEHNSYGGHFDVSIVVKEGSTEGPSIHRVVSGCQVSLVTPKDVTIGEIFSLNPKLGLNSKTPTVWNITTKQNGCPDEDYYSILNNTSPTNFLADLNVGDTAHLFSFWAEDSNGCSPPIQLFDSAKHNASTFPCMGGQDYSLGITLLASGNVVNKLVGPLSYKYAPPNFENIPDTIYVGECTDVSFPGIMSSLTDSIAVIQHNGVLGIQEGQASILIQTPGPCGRDTMFDIYVIDSTATEDPLTKVDLSLQYDPDSERFSVSMIAIDGDAKTWQERILVASQVSLAVPKSIKIEDIKSSWPRFNPAIEPKVWNVTTQNNECEDISYYSITNSTNFTHSLPEIVKNDTIELFSFKVNKKGVCPSDIKFYDPNIYPTSATPCMMGQDYTIGIKTLARGSIFNEYINIEEVPTVFAQLMPNRDTLSVGDTVSFNMSGIIVSSNSSIVEVVGGKLVARSRGEAMINFIPENNCSPDTTVRLVVIDESNTSPLSKVDLNMSYDNNTERFTVSMIATEGSVSAMQARILIGSQISILTPKSYTMDSIISVWPRINPNTVPKVWNKTVINKNCDDANYHSVTNNINTTHFLPPMEEGDTVVLFYFTLDEPIECPIDVVFFDSAIHPSAGAPCMNGQDFSIGLTLLTAGNIYNTYHNFDPGPVMFAELIPNTDTLVVGDTVTFNMPGAIGSNNGAIIEVKDNLLIAKSKGQATIFFEPQNGCNPDTSLLLTVIEGPSNVNNIGYHSVHVYPNPFSDYFYVNSNDEIEKIEITDQTGRLLDRSWKKGTNLVTVPTTGILIVRITTKNGNVSIHRIISI